MTSPQRLRARDDLTVISLDDEAVIYDEDTGNLHHLNQTAALVFSMCDGTESARELSASIALAYGVDAGEIEPQVRSVLRTLKHQGLVAGA